MKYHIIKSPSMNRLEFKEILGDTMIGALREYLGCNVRKCTKKESTHTVNSGRSLGYYVEV